MKTNKIKFDTSLLRARILAQFATLDDFAAAVGMKPATLASRLNSKTEFNVHEMQRICTALNLRNEEITKLFFTPEILVNKVSIMTCAEYLLFAKVTYLCIGRPDRQRYALNYTGRMEDLPAALMAI